MTGDRTSHMTVTYEVGFGQVTYIYAVSEDVSRKLRWKRDWLGRKPTGRDLVDWLEKKGCRLDSSEGRPISSATATARRRRCISAMASCTARTARQMFGAMRTA